MLSIKKIMFLHEGSFSNICAVGLGQNSKYHAASLGANCERRKKNITNPFGMEGTKWNSSITKGTNGEFFLVVTTLQRSRREKMRKAEGCLSSERDATATRNADTWKHITDKHLRGS